MECHCLKYFSAADQYLAYGCTCNNEAGVDKVWSWNLVAANQLISDKS